MLGCLASNSNKRLCGLYCMWKCHDRNCQAISMDGAASAAGRRMEACTKVGALQQHVNFVVVCSARAQQLLQAPCVSLDCRHPNMSPTLAKLPKSLSDALLPWVFVPQMAPAKGQRASTELHVRVALLWSPAEGSSVRKMLRSS